MPKFAKHDESVIYYCPGCDQLHSVPAERWHFNGDLEKPTLSPSVRHFIPAGIFADGTQRKEQTVCHYFIRNGEIQFCNDCEHGLKGQTLQLEEVSEWENRFSY